MVIVLSNYEEYFIKIFQKEKINFEREKRFKDLKDGLLRFDFYLGYINDKEVIIEIDGEYHFKPIQGRAALLKQQGYDRRKNSYCLANNIELYRIPYWEINNIKKFNNIFKDDFLVKDKWHNDYLISRRRNNDRDNTINL